MDLALFGRYFLDFALLYPSAFLCLASLWEKLRTPRRTACIAAGCITLLCIGCAALCAVFGLNSNSLLPAIVLVSFWLLRWRVTPEVTVSQTAFLFSISAVMMAVCSLLSTLLNAQTEISNPQTVCLASTALLRLGLAAMLTVLFWFTAVQWSRWLLREYSGEAFWQSAWPLPALYAVFLVYCMPLNPAVVLVGRLKIISVLAVSISLFGIFLLLYEMYRVAREFTRNARLDRENQLLAMESRRYMELQTYLDNTRRLRHDFRQHLHVIAGLTETGQLEELKSYLHQYESELSEPPPQPVRQRRRGCTGRILRPCSRAAERSCGVEAGTASAASHAGGRPVHHSGQSAGKRPARQPEAAAGAAPGAGDGADAQSRHAGACGGEPLRRHAEKTAGHPALHQARGHRHRAGICRDGSAQI